MPDISPTLVKELREKTNAGMMDCKRALDETSGDMLKAEELLRKKGIASASKWPDSWGVTLAFAGFFVAVVFEWIREK